MGLLSILMLTLAPTVSQILVQSERMASAHGSTVMSVAMPGMAGMEAMADMSAMPGMSNEDRLSSSQASIAERHAGSLSDHANCPADSDNPLAACAYCVLLIHLPGVISLPVAFLGVFIIATRVVSGPSFAPRFVSRITGPQARAPPFHP